MDQNPGTATAKFVRVVDSAESGFDIPTELYALSRPRWIGGNGGVGTIYVLLANPRGLWGLIAADAMKGLPFRKDGLTVIQGWDDTREAPFEALNIEVPAVPAIGQEA